jgi:hypothetical protein
VDAGVVVEASMELGDAGEVEVGEAHRKWS